MNRGGKFIARNYRDLNVWEKAHNLTLKIYEITETFPDNEQYSLTDQIRRSAVSIPSNIAEGCGRTSSQDFKNFLSIARGSASELNYQIFLAKDLEYLREEVADDLLNKINEIQKMLTGLITSI